MSSRHLSGLYSQWTFSREVDQVSLNWALTVVFAGTGLWFLFGCARPAVGTVDKVSGGTHAVMGIAMIAMVWGTALPTWLQVIFYGGATLWFAGLATIPRRPGFRPLHHALMAAAMAWMVTTMSRGHHHHVPVTAIVTMVLAWYFVLAAGPLMFRATKRLDAAGHATMSVGTGVLLLAMT